MSWLNTRPRRRDRPAGPGRRARRRRLHGDGREKSATWSVVAALPRSQGARAPRSGCEKPADPVGARQRPRSGQKKLDHESPAPEPQRRPVLRCMLPAARHLPRAWASLTAAQLMHASAAAAPARRHRPRPAPCAAQQHAGHQPDGDSFHRHPAGRDSGHQHHPRRSTSVTRRRAPAARGRRRRPGRAASPERARPRTPAAPPGRVAGVSRRQPPRPERPRHRRNPRSTCRGRILLSPAPGPGTLGRGSRPARAGAAARGRARPPPRPRTHGAPIMYRMSNPLHRKTDSKAENQR